MEYLGKRVRLLLHILYRNDFGMTDYQHFHSLLYSLEEPRNGCSLPKMQWSCMSCSGSCQILVSFSDPGRYKCFLQQYFD